MTVYVLVDHLRGALHRRFCFNKPQMSENFAKLAVLSLLWDVSCGNHFNSHSHKGAALLFEEAKNADGLPSEEKMRAMSMVVVDGGLGRQ